MNVIIQINGREAIPVRALPWLNPRRFSAQDVAEALAHDKGFESFAGIDAHYLEDGAIQPVHVNEWGESVTISIEEFAERDLPQAEWEELSLTALLAGVFVWRDEWEPAYNRSPYGPDALAALGDAADEEDVAKRTLNFAPLIPPELVKLVMEGFTQCEAQAPAPAQTAAAPAPVPVLTESARDAPEKEWHLMATPDALCAAFGTFTGMNKDWFTNLKDKPALKAARLQPGQGGRNKVEPLFYVYPVLIWLLDKGRKTGRPMQEATGWRMLKQNFPRVYKAYEVSAPDPD
jgi:hypothetical protein